MSTEDYYGNYSPDTENQGRYDYGDDDNNTEYSNTESYPINLTVKDSEDEKRLFVGGIGWGITQEDLQTHFSQYGGIEQVTVKTDPATGRSRGFAFIRFSDKQSVENVLISGPHVINGTKVEPNRVKARQNGNNKIFVGGLDPDFPEAELRAYFERFGKVESIELPFDRVSNQRKKFSFVTFESEAVVEQICKRPRQRIGGRDCDVKKAIRRQAAGGGGGGSDGRRVRGPNFEYNRRRVFSYGQSRGSNFGRERNSNYGQSRKYSGQRGSYGSYGSGSSGASFGSQNRSSGGYGSYSQSRY